MPADDASIAYARIAVACALAFALTSAREELAVWTSTARLQFRALTREFVNELALIRRSAETRFLAIAGAVITALALTKPEEKTFDSWFTTYRNWVRDKASAGDARGWRALPRAYARASEGAMTYGNVGFRGNKVTKSDWFIARCVVVNDAIVFLGIGGFWWGPGLTWNAVKRAAGEAKAIAERFRERATT